MSENKSTVPLKRELFLELENLSLKLHVMKRNVAEAERRFQAAVETVFVSEGKNFEEWALNLDEGMFVRKDSLPSNSNPESAKSTA